MIYELKSSALISREQKISVFIKLDLRLFFSPPAKKKAVSEAIAEIEKFTCVRFRTREKKKDDYFLKFFKGNGYVINLLPFREKYSVYILNLAYLIDSNKNGKSSKSKRL